MWRITALLMASALVAGWLVSVRVARDVRPPGPPSRSTGTKPPSSAAPVREGVDRTELGTLASSRRGPGSGMQQRLAEVEQRARQQLARANQDVRTPAVEQGRLIVALGRADGLYGAWFKRQGLDDEGRRTVQRLLAERQLVSEDIIATLERSGADEAENRAARQQLLTGNQQEFADRLRGVVGEAGYLSLNAFERTLPQRFAIQGLEQRLRYTASPLTEDQAERAIARLAATSGEPVPMFFNGAGITAGFTPAGVQRISEVLDPAQQQVLRTVLAEQQSRLARSPSRPREAVGGPPSP